MPSGLHRTYGAHHLHFITCSCYRRLPFLSTARSRDRFLSILEQTRQRYRFVVVGYVVMPEHIHLLLTEPEVGTPSTVMQVLKQRTAHTLLPKRKRRNPRQRSLFGDEPQRRAFWQASLLRLQRTDHEEARGKAEVYASESGETGLVEAPEQWRWSSYRFYLLEEGGPVCVNEGWTKISFRDRAA
jgi:putative transposase